MSLPPSFTLRPLTTADREWVTRFMLEHWGSTTMISRGVIHPITEFPGIVASDGDMVVGLITYRVVGTECEVTSLDSLREGQGIGSALLNAVIETARTTDCQRLWLITTNDNLHALRFYQKRGLTLTALYPNALAYSRTLKPDIPPVGMDGIPLRDEIELGLWL